MAGRTSAIHFDGVRRETVDQPLTASIGELLTSHGDNRISVDEQIGCNTYGCTPHPQSHAINFASSTASSISDEALLRSQAARDQLIVQSRYVGLKKAFTAATEAARTELALHLKLPRKTDIIFTASGTDAQLLALSLVRLGHGEPTSTIIVGSDQTGSGSVFSGAGQHFSTHTAQGAYVTRGSTISGLDSVRTLCVPFLAESGGFRSLSEMDAAVIEAVECEISAGRHVLLQAMDASKFGWRAPSDACLSYVAEKWRGQVQIVVDACQLRLSRTRLRTLLTKQYLVLVTGSKFFTGPAFSGAILIPPFWAGRAKGMMEPPAGLSDYSSSYDWPVDWIGIRGVLHDQPRVGQWLRWQAALEEMKLYFAVPDAMRRDTATALTHALERAISGSTLLQPLPPQPNGQSKKGQSIFSFIPTSGNAPLSPQVSASVYRALQTPIPDDENREGGLRPCHIGQPVPLGILQTAALRMSISARTIRTVWSPDARILQRNLAAQRADMATAIARLEQAIITSEQERNSRAI